MAYPEHTTISLTKPTKKTLEEYKRSMSWEEFFKNTLVLISQHLNEEKIFHSYLDLNPRPKAKSKPKKKSKRILIKVQAYNDSEEYLQLQEEKKNTIKENKNLLRK